MFAALKNTKDHIGDEYVLGEVDLTIEFTLKWMCVVRDNIECDTTND